MAPKVICKELNSFGLYQKRLCFLLLLACIPNAFTTFQFLVIHYTPPFRCNIDAETGMDNSTYENTSSTRMTAQVDACFVNNSALDAISHSSENRSLHNPVLANWNGSCETWKFDGEQITAVSELNMICEKSWKKPFMTSLFMLGKLVGGLMGGIISDWFGRRVTFFVFSAWQYVFTLLLSFVSDTTTYGILMFLCGISGLTNYIAAVLLGTEVVHPSKRTLVYFCMGFGYAIGCCLIALLAFTLTDWRWYLRVTSIIGVFYIPYLWLIDESPRWLLATGKTERAKIVLQKIAKMNRISKTADGKSETDEGQASSLLLETDITSSTWQTIKQVFHSPILLTRGSIVFLSWMVISGTYYAISLNVESLSGNRFLNIFLLGVAEMTALVSFYFSAQYLGRRNSLMVCMMSTALVVGATPLLKMWNGTSVAVLAVIGRLIAAASFATVYLYTTELFPTCVRNLMMGIANASARIGSMLAPFLIYAEKNSQNVAVPLGITAANLLCCALYLFLPKTNHVQLPQSITEAERMKSGVKLNCCERKKEDSGTDLEMQD